MADLIVPQQRLNFHLLAFEPHIGVWKLPKPTKS